MWKVQSVHRMWTSSDVAHAGILRFPGCADVNEGNDHGWSDGAEVVGGVGECEVHALSGAVYLALGHRIGMK